MGQVTLIATPYTSFPNTHTVTNAQNQ